MTEQEARIELLKKQYAEMMSRFNKPDIIEINRVRPQNNELVRLCIDVYLPTYLAGSGNTPIPSDYATFNVSAMPGTSFIVFHANFADAETRVAHPNIYANGNICINTQLNYTSLSSIVEKCLRAVVFDPGVDEYPRACSAFEDWFLNKKRNGDFPTVDLQTIFGTDISNTSPRNVNRVPLIRR